jgi:hypothetical protein
VPSLTGAGRVSGRSGTYRSISRFFCSTPFQLPRVEDRPMPALFGYILAIGIFLGGGYGMLYWLAAPEPVTITAK